MTEAKNPDKRLDGDGKRLPLDNPYPKDCEWMEERHIDPTGCLHCIWREGYVAAVKNHDASGCAPKLSGIFEDWE